MHCSAVLCETIMKESCNFELGSLKKKKKKEEEEKEKEKDEQEEERKKAFGLVLLQCFFALLSPTPLQASCKCLTVSPRQCQAAVHYLQPFKY